MKNATSIPRLLSGNKQSSFFSNSTYFIKCGHTFTGPLHHTMKANCYITTSFTEIICQSMETVEGSSSSCSPPEAKLGSAADRNSASLTSASISMESSRGSPEGGKLKSTALSAPPNTLAPAVLGHCSSQTSDLSTSKDLQDDKESISLSKLPRQRGALSKRDRSKLRKGKWTVSQNL
jgi:hypothetical protein